MARAKNGQEAMLPALRRCLFPPDYRQHLQLLGRVQAGFWMLT